MNEITGTIERRIYVNHKQFGTCITVGAQVFTPSVAYEFKKGEVPRYKFTVQQDGSLVDQNGNPWVKNCENPGCGPRLPKELRALHGEAFKKMSIAERKAFLKSLAPAAAAS